MDFVGLLHTGEKVPYLLETLMGYCIIDFFSLVCLCIGSLIFNWFSILCLLSNTTGVNNFWLEFMFLVSEIVTNWYGEGWFFKILLIGFPVVVFGTIYIESYWFRFLVQRSKNDFLYVSTSSDDEEEFDIDVWTSLVSFPPNFGSDILMIQVNLNFGLINYFYKTSYVGWKIFFRS